MGEVVTRVGVGMRLGERGGSGGGASFAEIELAIGSILELSESLCINFDAVKRSQYIVKKGKYG